MTYGSDFSGIDDLDLNLTFLEGETPEQLALEQAVARRYLTPRGGLTSLGAPDYGMDLRSFVADAIDLNIAQALIASEATKDERVESATCTISVRTDGAWLVSIAIVGSGDESFTLTFLVTTDNVQQIP